MRRAPGASIVVLFHVFFCLLTAEFTLITCLCGLHLIIFSGLGKEQLTNCTSLYKVNGHAQASLARVLVYTCHLDKVSFGQR